MGKASRLRNGWYGHGHDGLSVWQLSSSGMNIESSMKLVN